MRKKEGRLTFVGGGNSEVMWAGLRVAYQRLEKMCGAAGEGATAEEGALIGGGGGEVEVVVVVGGSRSELEWLTPCVINIFSMRREICLRAASDKGAG